MFRMNNVPLLERKMIENGYVVILLLSLIILKDVYLYLTVKYMIF